MPAHHRYTVGHMPDNELCSRWGINRRANIYTKTETWRMRRAFYEDSEPYCLATGVHGSRGNIFLEALWVGRSIYIKHFTEKNVTYMIVARNMQDCIGVQGYYSSVENISTGSFVVVHSLWIFSDEHASIFQESSLRQRQIPDAALKGR
ncbi:hypothetical protein J6590_048020 [Homalodisca vitripennis]|nr:hypothetical protein J6590_048020 [Homalodisca vitripennis]